MGLFSHSNRSTKIQDFIPNLLDLERRAEREKQEQEKAQGGGDGILEREGVP